jgi:uncharacterized protein involved in response to NO
VELSGALRQTFALGFRPFFLAAGGAGLVLPLAWLAVLRGDAPAPAWLDPFLWHGHEMLFGFVAAAIAGFLLTAVPAWTATAPIRGGRLAGLVSLWALGRAALAFAGALPAGAVAAADLAFPVALLVAVGRPILRARAKRQAGIVAALAMLAAANGAVHLDALGAAPGAARAALRLAIVFVGVLILVIGGRITPSFTQNAIDRAGAPRRVRARPWLDRASVGGALALALAELLAPRTVASGACAAVASPRRSRAWPVGRPGSRSATRCSPPCTSASHGSRPASERSRSPTSVRRCRRRSPSTRSRPARWAR